MKIYRIIAIKKNNPTFMSGWCDRSFCEEYTKMMLNKGYDVVIQNKQAL